MDVFRTVEEIRTLPDLKPQEEELLEKAEAGEWLVLGDGELPSEGDDTRSIRAGIIRYLLLGGCEGLRCHEKGVQIMGAYVSEQLDLSGCVVRNSLLLNFCRLVEVPLFESATIHRLYLDGSYCPGFLGESMTVKENLYFRYGFESTGKVAISGSSIGGRLDCEAGKFGNGQGIALHCDTLKVDGDVFMRNGFSATGDVRLVGARISGNLECDNGAFRGVRECALDCDGARIEGYVFLRQRFEAIGRVNFLGAIIGRDFDCMFGLFHNPSEVALILNKAKISGSFLWRSGSHLDGRMLLNSTYCGVLNDEAECWPNGFSAKNMNGFEYDLISGIGAVDAETRLKWLALDDVSDGFRPQPYQHLAKVLREMGHAEDARKVMVEKEKLQRADRLACLKTRLASMEPTARAPEDQYVAQMTRVDRYQLKFDLWWSPKWNFLFRRLVGYGYYPFNSFWAGLGLFLFAAAIFSTTWNTGAFAPNSPVILISEEWASVLSEDNPAKAWEEGPGSDYETYNSFAYAFDTVIPLIDLGQESAWSPSTSRGPVGWIAWWAKWILKIAGWIITALGAAALTGIIRRD